MIKILLAALLLAFPWNARAEFAPHEAPQTATKPKDVSVHGDKRVDEYFWLREKDNEAVLEHLRAENLHTEAVLTPAVELRKKLYNEMVGRLKETDSSV